jgi:hypothetical protein
VDIMTVVISKKSTKQQIGTLEIDLVGSGAPGYRIDRTKLTESVDDKVIEEIGRRVINASNMGGDLGDFRWDVRR